MERKLAVASVRRRELCKAVLRWHNDAHFIRRILTLVGIRWPFTIRTERVADTTIGEIESPDLG